MENVPKSLNLTIYYFIVNFMETIVCIITQKLNFWTTKKNYTKI